MGLCVLQRANHSRLKLLRLSQCQFSVLAKRKVIYSSKDGRTSKTFEALDWLTQLVTHIPNKGEQMVRYYGYYSNKSRGMCKKAPYPYYAMASRPFLRTSAKSLRDGPRGCLSPRSHWLTNPTVTLR